MNDSRFIAAMDHSGNSTDDEFNAKIAENIIKIKEASE